MSQVLKELKSTVFKGCLFFVIVMFIMMVCALIFDNSPEAMHDNTEITDSYSQELLDKANGGSPRAQYYMGEYLSQGNGVDVDYEEAVKWYRKSAEQSYILAEWELANCYYYGDGVTRNYEEALKWYRRFYDHENGREAEMMIGLCYLNGHGVKKDGKKGAEWLLKAAKNGDDQAMFYIGECYLSGNGVAKDHKEAFKWLKKAALNGHEGAFGRLAECYLHGYGAKKDKEKAEKLLRKAADLGNAYASETLNSL